MLLSEPYTVRVESRLPNAVVAIFAAKVPLVAETKLNASVSLTCSRIPLIDPVVAGLIAVAL